MIFNQVLCILTVKFSIISEHTMTKLKILFMIGCLLSFHSYSQNWLRIDSVFSPSGIIPQSFSAPGFGDLDSDGDFDLVLGNLGNQADYFQNITTQLPSAFMKDTTMLYSIYAGGLQFTNSDYPALIDLDADGDLDLVIGGYNGLLYYQNVGNAMNAVWLKVDTVFSNSVNSQIGTDAKPAFADLDADGDLDLLVGIGESLLGGPTPGLTFGFRNTGTPSNPIFLRDDNLVSGIIDVGLNSYPALADLDNDNDFDLLLGRDLSSFVYYKNTGTASSPIWTREFTTFTGVETTTYWKDPTFCDLDGDGDLDLIYGTDGGSLYFYQNNGTQSAPLFQYNVNYFSIIKVSGSSTVSCADFDNDGDFDLLSGSPYDKMQYLKNEGTPSKPKFVKTTSIFSGLNPGFRCSPVFVDIDKDGDYDIVSGNDAGTIFCYINNGSTFSTNTAYFGSLDVGYASAPAFVDIEGDGDEDVLIGAETGANYVFLERTGNTFVTPVANPFSTIVFPNYSRPTFADIDNDGDFDLILGKSFGEVICYENVGNVLSAQWQRNDALVSPMKVKQNAAPGFADLDGDARIDCIIGEYDGNFTYYKNLFAPVSVENEIYEIPSKFYLSQNYPNPFNPATRIRYAIPALTPSLSHLWRGSNEVAGQRERVILRVYDILGNEVVTLVNEEQYSGIYEVDFNADKYKLASGLYIYRLQIGESIASKKMLLIQ